MYSQFAFPCGVRIPRKRERLWERCGTSPSPRSRMRWIHPCTKLTVKGQGEEEWEEEENGWVRKRERERGTKERAEGGELSEWEKELTIRLKEIAGLGPLNAPHEEKRETIFIFLIYALHDQQNYTPTPPSTLFIFWPSFPFIVAMMMIMIMMMMIGLFSVTSGDQTRKEMKMKPRLRETGMCINIKQSRISDTLIQKGNERDR